MNIEHGISSTKDLKLNIQASQDIEPNLADEKELVDAVTDFVSKKVDDNLGALEPHWDDLIHYDYMFRCGLNETEKSANKPMKAPEEAKSNVGATMFFRQVMQSAAKIYSFMTARDSYWKYSPVSTKGIPLSAQESEMQANMLNTLVGWNLKKDKFDPKLMSICTAVSKDGLAYVGLNWIRRREDRKITIPGPVSEDGTRSEPSVIDLPAILVENRAEVVLYDPFTVIIDPNIGDMQKQACPAVTQLMSISDAVQMVESGYWSEEQFKKIDSAQGWDGTSGRPRLSDQDANSGLTSSTISDSGLMLVWNVWANLPIGDDGKLDQAKNIPKRYICTFVGNQISDAVCVRISRNDDPEDKVPIEVIHDYTDTKQGMFRISKGRVLKNNFAVEVTTVNQMIDNVSLVMNPPFVERKGRVESKDRKYGRTSRIIVKDSVNEDFKELIVADRTQTCQATLAYIKDDSKMAIATDPAQMGEGLGARATATESSGVMRLSAAPSVMNAKHVASQLFSYLGTRMKLFWQTFALDEQVVRITDSDAPITEIRPVEIWGDFDVQVDVVDQVVDDILSESKIAQDLQALGSNPQLSAMVDWQSLLDEYFIRRYGRSFVKENTDADAVNQAHRDCKAILAGQPVNAIEGQDHKTHLRILRADLIKYRGLEAQYKPQIDALKALIEQHEQMLGEGSAPATHQQTATPSPAQLGAPAAAGNGGANMIPTPRV